MASDPLTGLPRGDARQLFLLEAAATMASDDKLRAGTEFLAHRLPPLKRKALHLVLALAWENGRAALVTDSKRALDVAARALAEKEAALERVAFLEGVLARRQAREDEQVRAIDRLVDRGLRLQRLVRRIFARRQRR